MTYVVDPPLYNHIIYKCLPGFFSFRFLGTAGWIIARNANVIFYWIDNLKNCNLYILWRIDKIKENQFDGEDKN